MKKGPVDIGRSSNMNKVEGIEDYSLRAEVEKNSVGKRRVLILR